MTTVPRICSVESCDRPHSCKGFCAAHHKRYLAGGDLSTPILNRRAKGHSDTCPTPGCSQRIRLRGYCQTHAVQVKRTGYAGVALTRGDLKTEGLKCFITGCDDVIRSRKGVCKTHRRVLDVYRLTALQLNLMYDSGCGICHSKASLVVDHDHSCCSRETTGRNTCGQCIRGILCDSCNRGLGLLGDTPEKVQRAFEYLSGHLIN